MVILLTLTICRKTSTCTTSTFATPELAVFRRLDAVSMSLRSSRRAVP